jgi:uncharacterized integral membrane protein
MAQKRATYTVQLLLLLLLLLIFILVNGQWTCC